MAFIPYYILVLLFLIGVDYLLGRHMQDASGMRRKALLSVSIAANLGTLFIFKYFNFFNSNLSYLASFLGWKYPIQALRLALPLGLSFHVFQSLSYVIEVYRGRVPAERHVGIYALYVMFFPQLVAGPIERPYHLLPQLHALPDFQYRDASEGAKLMVWGFFKKLVIADRFGVLVDFVYAHLGSTVGPLLAVAVAAFAIQLYCDFSGYSDIARGSARMFGIRLMKNFDLPFSARSIEDFWRRWHISLSTWLRDYVFYPYALRASRYPRLHLYAAIMITFLLSGLWHGAGWTFLIMGFLFGGYIVVGHITKSFRNTVAASIGLALGSRLRTAVQISVTCTLMSIAWVFFRAPNIRDAFYLITHLFSGWGQFFEIVSVIKSHEPLDIYIGLDKFELAIAIGATCIMLVVEALQRRYRLSARLLVQSTWIRWAALYCLIGLILYFGFFKTSTFIYFQF